jgi:hypothetical protein
MNQPLSILLTLCFAATSFAAHVDNPSAGVGTTGGDLSNTAINGVLGSVTGAISYLSLDVPSYDPVGGQLNVGSVAGTASTLDYATATLASGVTDTWHAVSVSSNGLIVAAWTRSIASGRGYVYIGTNGPNSLVKNNLLGLQITADIKVTADGSKVIVSHYDDPWYNGMYIKSTTNNGASWDVINFSSSANASTIDASDDGSVIVCSGRVSTNGGASWSGVPGGSGSWDYRNCAVSGDGNVIMTSWWVGPAGPNQYHFSTNRGVTFTANPIGGSGYEPFLGWGEGYACATRTGDRIYIATDGNPSSDDGEGNIAYFEGPNYDALYRITPGGAARKAYKSVSCSPDGRGIIAVATREAGRVGTAYVSTNFGVTWSDATNLIDVGGGTTTPYWLGKGSWGHTFNGGYAVKGGSGDGKIYRVEVGAVVTNTLNLLGDVNVLGTLAVNGNSVLTNETDTLQTVVNRGSVATNRGVQFGGLLLGPSGMAGAVITHTVAAGGVRILDSATNTALLIGPFTRSLVNLSDAIVIDFMDSVKVYTNLIVTGNTTNTGSITAGGGFYGNGSGLTNIMAAQVGAVSTSDGTYYAAPACYQVTITNTSAMSYTNNWSPTSAVSRITATSTGTVTFVMNWPASQMAYWGFCYDATGMPSTVFPAGAIYYTNGFYSATAPSLGVSNYISVMHSCASYQIMAFTNTLGTWGTP